MGESALYRAHGPQRMRDVHKKGVRVEQVEESVNLGPHCSGDSCLLVSGSVSTLLQHASVPSRPERRSECVWHLSATRGMRTHAPSINLHAAAHATRPMRRHRRTETQPLRRLLLCKAGSRLAAPAGGCGAVHVGHVRAWLLLRCPCLSTSPHPSHSRAARAAAPSCAPRPPLPSCSLTPRPPRRRA